MPVSTSVHDALNVSSLLRSFIIATRKIAVPITKTIASKCMTPNQLITGGGAFGTKFMVSVAGTAIMSVMA